LVRNIETKIERALALFPVVAIIGSRQCGKSTLVRKLRPDWKYYDLEQMTHFELVSEDPEFFFQRNPHSVIIDEAQEYPALFKTLRGVIDEDRTSSGRFLITGSSSLELVQGLSESLAGRMAIFELSPFKSNEVHQKPLSALYEILGSSFGKKDLLDRLEALESPLSHEDSLDCWRHGGYPEPLIKGVQDPDFHGMWMENFFTTYLQRDIRKLFPRLNIDKYRKLISVLSRASGTIINKSALATTLEVSSPTVKDYLDIFEYSFLWRNLRSFENNPAKAVQKMPKGYYRDSGLLNYLLKIRGMDDLMDRPNSGDLFEGFVIEEIVRGFGATPLTGIDFFFYRTRDRSEVDLIIDAPFGIVPVEIKLGRKTASRRLSSLKGLISDMNLPCGLLINNSDRIEFLDRKIVQIPVNYI
jgi:predicted AAA+ superfamily ATPase